MTGKARSATEMRFAISLATCPACGTPVDAEALRFEGSGTGWAYTGPCTRCRTPLAFTFESEGDPLAAPVPRGELGGDTPSQIIQPGQLIAEIDRLAARVRPDPTQLGVEEWRANRDANGRMLVCLAELAKFVPAGADGIADGALSDDERADKKVRPERYGRRWIEATRAEARQVWERIGADVKRIDAIEAGGPAVPAAELDRDALRAHEAWVKRGQKGEGRLVLRNASARQLKIGAAELTGVRLVDADFVEADLAYAHLDDSELDNVELSGANLTSVSLRGATIKTGSFAAAAMALAKLEDAVVEGAGFEGADLDRSQWQTARVEGARFDDARFGNAALDGATFVRCSFVAADFGPTTASPAATTMGALFEDCDLRETSWDGRDLSGAKFVKCRMAGVSGAPASLEGVVIELPDLSEDGDGSDVGEAADVLAMWGIELA